jgi:hypothetical protein
MGIVQLLDWLFGSRPSHGVGSLPAGRYGQDGYEPAGEWAQATAVVAVTGLRQHRDGASRFLSAAQQAQRNNAQYGVALRPAPGNPGDPHAIEVWGQASGQSWHIGFLDQVTARAITETFVSRGIPIAAKLESLRIRDNGRIDVKVIVLAPFGIKVAEF